MMAKNRYNPPSILNKEIDMRRLVVLFILGCVIITGAIAAAQPEIPRFIPIEPQPPVPFAYTVPLEPATWEEVVAQLPVAPSAPAPSDSCAAAPSLNLSPADGGQAIVNSYTESASDPILNCTWGIPSRPSGYRTAWYKVTPPTGGTLVVEALPNAEYQENYDTIIAIHTGSCANLVTLTCNDDTNGFLSHATALVQQGVTYYIEVADWHFGVNGTARLSLIAYMTETDSYWQWVDETVTTLSRHTAVQVGTDFYIIGGLTETGSTPVRTQANRKYNTVTRQWTSLVPMPTIASTCLDNSGYAATDSAYINGKIYLPSGYAGNPNAYCGVHMVYDIASNSWSTANPNTQWPAPLGWSQLVEYPPVNGYFMIGGLTGTPLTTNANPTDDLYLFTPDSGGGTWLLQDEMDQARYGHVAALLGDNICVVGGINNLNQVISDGQCYDLGQSTWGALPPLNYPRFNAGSAVGPDGRWYVFGGTNASLNSISPTEVYDPVSNTWQVLDVRYNLGAVKINGPDRPPRSWVQGDFVGGTLWVFGGEQMVGSSASSTLNLIEQLPLFTAWPQQLLLPIIRNSPVIGEPNDTFPQAQPHPPNHTVFYNFANDADYYDVYRFDLLATGPAQIYLRHIPANANYDLLLYDANKTLLDSSRNIGSLDEEIGQTTMGAGAYYVVVVRAYPLTNAPTGYYSLRIEQ
jgi:N-acetylneuraminic acid mutarotase